VFTSFETACQALSNYSLFEWPGANNRILPRILNHLHYFNIYLPFTHINNIHWRCSLSTGVWVLTHRKGTCRVLLHVSAAWSWRQHHDSDWCAAVFIISFISTVLLSLRHVADIVSRLLQVLTHAGVRPTSSVSLPLEINRTLNYKSFVQYTELLWRYIHSKWLFSLPSAIWILISLIRDTSFYHQQGCCRSKL
jgi:hypothetical protein